MKKNVPFEKENLSPFCPVTPPSAHRTSQNDQTLITILQAPGQALKTVR